MANAWKKNTNEFESSAKVVDGNLILSLPDAMNPIVWRMELGSVKASALEVKAQENNFILLLKTPKGEVHEIAPFDNRDTAVRALMRVSAALQGAEGRIAPSLTSTPTSAAAAAAPNGDGSPIKWIIALIGVAAVILLFSYLGSLTPRMGSELSAPAAQSSEGGSGVPESADQLLRGF